MHALRDIDIEKTQVDIGIELIHRIYCRAGLGQIVEEAQPLKFLRGHAVDIFLAKSQHYLSTVDTVMEFLIGADDTLAHRITAPGFLPSGKRFEVAEEVAELFGTSGTRDYARYLATLYIEDIADFIRDTVAPEFALNRYGESLAVAASDFDSLHAAAQRAPSIVDSFMADILQGHLDLLKPTLVGFTVPFPGNFYGALRLAAQVKEQGNIRTVLGGGYVNTELREFSDIRLFEYFDWITLDDGEAPLRDIIDACSVSTQPKAIPHTFILKDAAVKFHDGPLVDKFEGIPDYKGLELSSYLSLSDTANPMQRLWSDGLWIKMTLAHGCYWKRCSFCDISLDYIARYQEHHVGKLVDEMQRLIEQTGSHGFHFVDEAAPPDLLRRLALEILRRDMVVSWWTNIRFEKGFTTDLCRLLARSGCIAVSGGLEVASERLLVLMKKGTSIAQVSQVARDFREAGVFVHAYLMYGFPTQTAQETVDSLEVVRQLFEAEVIQSAFWHRFALTAHSGIAQDVKRFSLKIIEETSPSFALNEIHYEEEGADVDHGAFGPGLRKSLLNYMHSIDLDRPVHSWFDFEAPKASIPDDLIQRHLAPSDNRKVSPNLIQLVWLGQLQTQSGVAESGEPVLTLSSFDSEDSLELPEPLAQWIVDTVERARPGNEFSLSRWRQQYEATMGYSAEELESSDVWDFLNEAGLLRLYVRGGMTDVDRQ